MRAKNASAYRSGARHSMPRSRAKPRNVSSSNHCLDRWLPKCAQEQLNLALEDGRRKRHIQIGLAHIAVPLGNLVFENQAIAEGVPSVPADLAMILVRVVSRCVRMRSGSIAALERLEPGLDLLALRREKSRLESCTSISICARAAPDRKSAAELRASLFARHRPPLSTHQVTSRRTPRCDQAQQRPARANLDVVGMRAEAQNRQPLVRRAASRKLMTLPPARNFGASARASRPAPPCPQVPACPAAYPWRARSLHICRP